MYAYQLGIQAERSQEKYTSTRLVSHSDVVITAVMLAPSEGVSVPPGVRLGERFSCLLSLFVFLEPIALGCLHGHDSATFINMLSELEEGTLI